MQEESEDLSGLASAYASMHLPGRAGGAVPLVLLHGSNGDEHDLIALSDEIRPGAHRLAVRGDVAMRPGYAFFRRFPDRQVDVEDLRFRASRLAPFISLAAARLGWGAKPVVIGYSNGAIMAITLLLDSPHILAGAVLLRPLLPFDLPPGAALSGKLVLILDGLDDRRRGPEDGSRAREALRRGGAIVHHETSTSGHVIGPDDVAIVRTWISRLDPAIPLRHERSR